MNGRECWVQVEEEEMQYAIVGAVREHQFVEDQVPSSMEITQCQSREILNCENNRESSENIVAHVGKNNIEQRAKGLV